MNRQLEWRVLSQKTVLADRWINVRADSCLTAAGNKIEPYYVLTYPDWVNVVAITPADCLVMVRQYRHGVGRIFLELPGGQVDADDALPSDAANRELAEETGFIATTMRTIASLFVNPASHTNQVHTCVATNVTTANVQRLDAGEEGLTVELVPVPDIIDGIFDGRISQSMHVTSIILALKAVNRIQISNTLK
jgi:8-oxo-dGTP pyrophosphatase MutT (NUDIX family)